jgi:alkylation response protein AidB-like acyl-CoA dehydrogenase
MSGSHASERNQNRIYHDLLLGEETQRIRDEVRAFAELEIAPLAYDIGQREETRENFPFALFKAMAKAGLFRIPFSSEVGGRGLKNPVAATAVALEEISYFSNSVAAIYDVHCVLAGNALKNASPELRRQYLDPLLSGEKIGAFATTEPEASSDISVQSVRTIADRDGDGFKINGTKRFITNAPVADFVVALCRTDNTLTEFIVDLSAQGVTVFAPDQKLGNRGQLTADIHFDDVPVSADNIVGEPGKGLRIALATLTHGRVSIAASGVGMAQSVFDEATNHLIRRRAFGKALAQFQYWQFKMAEYATRIENARNLYTKAALRLDSGIEFPEPEVAMAKYYCTELACDIARDGIQIFGGYGFMRRLSRDGSTYKVEEVYRDSKVAEIYEGTNEIQKWVIARAIFGKDLTG